MDNGIGSLISAAISKLFSSTQNFEFADLFSWVLQIGQKIFEEKSSQEIYEVLDYESTLEINDVKGTKASFCKTKKVRYLQNNIIAFQDHAWGDGKILLNYRTSRGRPVDRYRSGFKTHILLSLREVKNKGDIDEFNIQWNIRQGFLTVDGYWATDISQKTKHVKVNLIFPKSRPPYHLLLEESNRKRSFNLNQEAKKQLPDGRWKVTWEMNDPELYELYVLRWNW